MGAKAGWSERKKSAMRQVYFWRLICLVLIVFITWVTLTPDTEHLDGSGGITKWLSALLFGSEEYSDKIGHFSAYAALGFCLLPGKLKLFNRSTIVLALLAIYGGGLELLQNMSENREASIADALANTLGLVLGSSVAFFFFKFFGRYL